jgi:hypothetical protein
MNSPVSLARRASLSTAAALAVACLASAPLAAQTVINPSRQGSTSNDQAALDSTFNTQRMAEARAELLNDHNRQAENWQAAGRFASCATDMNQNRVRELLDQAVEGKAGKRVELGDFVNRNQGCVVAVGGIDRDILRGALAERVVTASNPELPPPGNAESVMTFLKAVSVPRMDKDDPFIAGQLLAECRVGFAPVAARALIATEAGSQAEAGALAAMKAVTPQCNSLDTAETKLTPWFERAYAAQALYHWIGFDGARG